MSTPAPLWIFAAMLGTVAFGTGAAAYYWLQRGHGLQRSSMPDLETGTFQPWANENTPLILAGRPLSIITTANLHRNSRFYSDARSPDTPSSAASSPPPSSYFQGPSDDSSLATTPDSDSAKLERTAPVTPEEPPSDGLKQYRLPSRGFPCVPTHLSSFTTVILCLAHSKDLLEFFTSLEYQNEVAEDDGHHAAAKSFASIIALTRDSRPLSTVHHIPALYSHLLPLKSHPSLKIASRTGSELLQHVLRQLHVSLNDGESWASEQPTYIKAPVIFDGVPQPQALADHARHFQNMRTLRNDSIITDLFDGLLCHRSQCLVCGETAVLFEEFTSLNLSRSTAPFTLVELLWQFEQPEYRSGKHCTNCRASQPSISLRQIYHLPTTLVIYLNAENLPLRRKYPPVSYPMTGLCMPDYANSAAHPFSRPLMASYDLFGVRERYSVGPVDEAIYTALVKDPTSNEWGRLIGDAITRVEDLDEIFSPHADLLFYQCST